MPKNAIFRAGARCLPGALLVACALLGAGVWPATSAARPLVTGITGFDAYGPATFQQTRAAGARFAHIVVPWEDVAPANEPKSWQPEDPADGHYAWTWLDEAVTEAVGAGLTPVLEIYGAPSWAQRCQPPPDVQFGGGICNLDPAALAAFSAAAARRYSGRFEGLPRVQYWQGLNEPNLAIFFYPQFNGGKPVSPALYRRLANAFYFAVKSVDPSNLVLAAGLGPIARPHWTIGPMRFTRLLLCMTGRRNPHPTHGSCGGGVHFDIFDVHPYTTGGPTHEGGVDDVELGDLGKLQALLKAADRAGRIHGSFKRTPLWITEFSWDSKPPDPGGLPMKIETRWVAEALYRSWKAGVSHFFWYSLRDELPDSGQSFSETVQSGLYFRGATLVQDRPKEMLYAFRFPFVAYHRKAGLFFWGRTPTSERGRVAIQLWQHGHWRTRFIAHADAQGTFGGVIPTSYGSNKHGLARACFGGESAPPFSLHPVKDFRQPPFGR